MKIISILLTTLLFNLWAGCMRGDYSSDKVASPSGKYYFITSVNRTDKSKNDFADVILSLFNAEGKLITKFNTHAGDFNKWAIDWEEKNDTIIMNSSDIGTFAWRLDINQLKQLELTENLKKQADEIKIEKYK